MLYTVIITGADGTASAKTIDAETMQQAHELGDTLRKANTDTVTAYATTTDEQGNIITEGVKAGALTVVKRTAANMIIREGGDIQYRLYAECRRPDTDDPDVLDCISVATLALLAAIKDGMPIDEQYHRAYLAFNEYLRASRQINLSVTAMRTMYIEDIDGDIISVTREIARILAPDERYTPIAEEDATDKNSVQRYVVKTIAGALTPSQITVLRYLARGYSLRQIAEAMNRSAPTVQVHINRIRETALKLFPDGYKNIVK